MEKEKLLTEEFYLINTEGIKENRKSAFAKYNYCKQRVQMDVNLVEFWAESRDICMVLKGKMGEE